MSTLMLRQTDVAKLLSVRDAFTAAEAAYKILGSRKLLQPPIVSILISDHNGEIDIKSGYSIPGETVGIKVASGYPDNPDKYDLQTLYSMTYAFDIGSILYTRSLVYRRIKSQR